MNRLVKLLRESPIALYVHMPICETKCPYCDFNTYAGIDLLIPECVRPLTPIATYRPP